MKEKQADLWRMVELFPGSKTMAHTDAQTWMEAHEIIECKPLKGRWTAKTCLEIAGKSKQKSKSKAQENAGKSHGMVPCANCPILAALEKKV
jgi:hypothetical protein